jgi:hypothetical protein
MIAGLPPILESREPRQTLRDSDSETRAAIAQLPRLSNKIPGELSE